MHPKTSHPRLPRRLPRQLLLGLRLLLRQDRPRRDERRRDGLLPLRLRHARPSSAAHHAPPTLQRRRVAHAPPRLLPRRPAPIPPPVQRPLAHHRLARRAHGRHDARHPRRRRNPLRQRAPQQTRLGRARPLHHRSRPHRPRRHAPPHRRTAPPLAGDLLVVFSLFIALFWILFNKRLMETPQPHRRHRLRHRRRHHHARASTSPSPTARRPSTASRSKPGPPSPPAACSAPPPPPCSGTGA